MPVLSIQEIFSSAVRIVLCHNHPSQDTTASKQDIFLTKKVQEAGTLLGIPLADHIIICENSYFSFYEADML